MNSYIQNAIHIPGKGIYLMSSHRHDFITYVHDDERTYSIDGGREYFRAVGDFSLVSDGTVVLLHLTPQSTEDEVRDKALWGSRGKDGLSPMTYKPIKSFSRDHLRAIKKNCRDYMNPVLLGVVKYWLKTKYNE